jgi:uncharacterized membrane protein YhdT
MQMFLFRFFNFAFRLTIFTILVTIVVVYYYHENPKLIGLPVLSLVCSVILAILFRKLSWFFSPESRRYRHQKKFEERKKRLEEKSRLNCNRLSTNSCRKNMHGLVALTRKELGHRKGDITPNIFAKIESALTRYEVEMKINAVAKIYDVVTKTETATLNEKLKVINDF